MQWPTSSGYRYAVYRYAVYTGTCITFHLSLVPLHVHTISASGVALGNYVASPCQLNDVNKRQEEEWWLCRVHCDWLRIMRTIGIRRQLLSTSHQPSERLGSSKNPSRPSCSLQSPLLSVIKCRIILVSVSGYGVTMVDVFTYKQQMYVTGWVNHPRKTIWGENKIGGDLLWLRYTKEMITRQGLRSRPGQLGWV